MSDEQKEKIRQSNLGQFVSEATRQKMREAKKGYIPWNKGKSCPSMMWNKHCVGRTPWNKGKHISKETREKISRKLLGHKRSPESIEKGASKMRGENNHKWISDRNLLKDDSKERGGQLHREWSKNVKNRDHWKCKISNQDCKGRIEAHHIFGWTDYPDLRYEIGNGITLCHYHHPRKWSEEERLSPYFQELIKSQIN